MTWGCRAGFWDHPGRADLLAGLWSAGLSASEVAEAIGHGCTRNMVIGKKTRLGLAERPRCERAVPPRRATRRARGEVSPPRPAGRRRRRCDPGLPPEELAAVFGMAGLIRDALDLSWRTCRWPLGDPHAADFSFCGQPTDGSAYCAGHHWRGTRH